MHRFPVLLFILFVAASADVYYDGPCPPLKSMDYFDFSRYQGKWYEIARYPNAGEEGEKGKCTTAEYFVNGNVGKVRNTHVVAGVKSYINGDIAQFGPGTVIITYSFGGKSKSSLVNILKTDYNNFSIAYSCKYFKDTDTHQILSWIKSRRNVLDPTSLAIINNYIQSSPLLEANKYIFNDFTGPMCTYTFVKEIQEFIE